MKILGLVLLLVAARPAAAQEYGAGFARFLGYNEDRARYFSAEQMGERGPFVWRQEAEASQTVLRSTDSAWMVSGRAGELRLGSQPVVIPQTGVVVPEKLWSAQGGLGYRRDIGERRRWGANAAFGSASDRLFLAWREDQLSASAYYQVPGHGRNSWLFLLNYSNNRPFANNVPLPGVAYMIDDPAHRLEALIGFPFLHVRWRPDDDWTLSAGLFGPASYSLEAARKLCERVSAYARFEKTPLQWLRAARVESTDRLVFDSKQAVAGIRAGLWRGASLDLAAGRAFDRRFFEARDASRLGGTPRAALSNATVLQTALSWRWGGA